MRIARVFLDCDMRCGFEGLRAVAKDTKFEGKGDFILFINGPGTAFKMLVGNQYLTYYKNGNRRIPLEAIQLLPEFFDGTKFDLQGAIRKAVMGKLRIPQ